MAFDGQVFLSFFIAYPVLRSVVECFRGDEVRGFVLWGALSTSQFVSILIFIPAMACYVVRRRSAAPGVRSAALPGPRDTERRTTTLKRQARGSSMPRLSTRSAFTMIELL